MVNKNTHGSFIRNAVIGLIDLLNTESQYEVVRQDEKKDIHVPFFYNFGVDEQFMKDFFFNLPPNCNIPLAEGNYERLPRGVVTLESVSVNTSNLTNSYVRGNWQAEARDDNDRKIAVGHSARMRSLPLSITFSVEVRVDTANQAFKILEMFMDTFYANRVIFFQHKGLRIPAQFRFPDSDQINKNYTFDFNTQADNFTSLKGTVIMEVPYPTFDRASDRLSNNVMQQIGLNNTFIDQDTPLAGSAPAIFSVLTGTLATISAPVSISPTGGTTITVEDTDSIDLHLTANGILSGDVKPSSLVYEGEINAVQDITIAHTTHNLVALGSILIKNAAGIVVEATVTVHTNLDVDIHFGGAFTGTFTLSV